MPAVKYVIGSKTSVMAESLDFVDCYRNHYGRLVRSLQVAGLSYSDAEDVAQSAFAITLRNWMRVKNGTNPPGYVYRVAFRSVNKRELNRVSISEVPVEQVPAPDVVSTISIEAALQSLPLRRRTVAVLYLVLGFSTHDISSLLGLADGTVRKHIEEARRDLRVWLETQE